MLLAASGTITSVPTGSSASASSASSLDSLSAAQRSYSISAASHCSLVPQYSVCPTAAATLAGRALAPTEADMAMITPAPVPGEYYYYNDDGEEYHLEGWESYPENLDGLEIRDATDNGEETVQVEVILETTWVFPQSL